LGLIYFYIFQDARLLRRTTCYSLLGSKGAPFPRADSFSGLEMRALRGAQAKKVPTKLKHGARCVWVVCVYEDSMSMMYQIKIRANALPA